MKVKLTKGRTAQQGDVIALQQIVGSSLPRDILEFWAANDGAEPEANIFKIDKGNEGGVNGFIPVKEIPGEMQRIGDLPNGFFPIAWAEGGNYVAVDPAAAGGIFFWDHEKTDDMVKLADSFRSFLELLEPFDVKSIRLKPGQVKKVWIDPDFLKGLKD